MAEDTRPKRFKLPKEARDNLVKLSPQLDEAEEALIIMEKMDMDVTELRKQLKWAANVRNIMMSEFD